MKKNSRHLIWNVLSDEYQSALAIAAMKSINAPKTCFECDQGHYEMVVQPYSCGGQDGNVVVVPDVTFFRCTHCGEELIPAESCRYISRYSAEANEQLTKAELHAMLEASGLSQKDFAEAIGLGEKTFHRWLKGTQIASRSMGYYLRAMQRFPEAFEWVKQRGWRDGAPDSVTALPETIDINPTVQNATHSA